jgi:hypothetical protein
MFRTTRRQEELYLKNRIVYEPAFSLIFCKHLTSLCSVAKKVKIQFHIKGTAKSLSLSRLFEEEHFTCSIWSPGPCKPTESKAEDCP